MAQLFKNRSNASLRDRGFTLIEMAMVILVLGLMFAGSMRYYELYKKEKTLEDNDVTMSDVMDSLEEYRIDNGHYPCPASLSSPRNNGTYGFEFDGIPGTPQCEADAAAPVLAGNCGSDPASGGGLGVCIQQGLALPWDDAGSNLNVRIGALPFKDLALPEAAAYDSEGSRLIYVVSEELMSNATYRDQNGRVSIVDGDGNSVVADVETGVMGGARVLVFGPGKNKTGAFDLDGNMIEPCVGMNLGIHADTANCDFLPASGGRANQAMANFVNILRNENLGVGDGEFDDSMLYTVNTLTGQDLGWRQ